MTWRPWRAHPVDLLIEQLDLTIIAPLGDGVQVTICRDMKMIVEDYDHD